MQCPKCGSPVIAPESARFCALCNYPFLSLNAPEKAPLDGKTGVPWEHVEQLGIGPAIMATLRMSLLAPGEFFTRLASSRNSFMAWLYALIIGSIGSIFNFVWTYFLITPLLAMFPLLDQYTGKSAISVAGLVATPLIITAKLFLTTFYFHVLLFLMRSNRQNTSATFRIVCYTQSTAILDCIPLLGPILSPLWSLYLLAIGLSKVHAISVRRAIIIIFLPLVFIVGAGALLVLTLFGASMVFQDVFKDLLNLIRY